MAAAEAKLLHRDIKPGNILVMKSGYASSQISAWRN